MTRVIIQPSYGNKAAREHWKDTLDQEANFLVAPRVDALTPAQRGGLQELHPDGKARFWGATGNHDSRMAALQTGDVVLFTGGRLVRAVGEVGFSFYSPAFADLLWRPDPDRGSYRNVYSLLSFQPTAIPYDEIWELEGFNPGDNFMGLRFLDDVKSATILNAFHIDTMTARREAADRERAVMRKLASGSDKIVDPEAVNVVRTSYDRTAGTILVHRAEAVLVRRYRRTLHGGVATGRLVLWCGVTDLCVQHPDGLEIVEAKSGSSHEFVREVLGQLLDYSLHCTSPVALLSALFPAKPGEDDIGFLHSYGIDCIYETDSGCFERAAAPGAWRSQIAGVWSRRRQSLQTPGSSM
jgi:hypothetical protein